MTLLGQKTLLRPPWVRAVFVLGYAWPAICALMSRTAEANQPDALVSGLLFLGYALSYFFFLYLIGNLSARNARLLLHVPLIFIVQWAMLYAFVLKEFPYSSCGDMLEERAAGCFSADLPWIGISFALYCTPIVAGWVVGIVRSRMIVRAVRQSEMQ